MLDLYAAEKTFKEPSLTQRVLGQLTLNELQELDRLELTNTQDFNQLCFFEDRFIDPVKVKAVLMSALRIRDALCSQPGFKSPPAEKMIQIFQTAASKNVGIQTICD